MKNQNDLIGRDVKNMFSGSGKPVDIRSLITVLAVLTYFLFVAWFLD